MTLMCRKSLVWLVVSVTLVLAAARHNKDSVRSGIATKCDIVLFGKEIDNTEYGAALVAAGLDIFAGGGGSVSLANFERMLKAQAKEVGMSLVKEVVLNGKHVEHVLDGKDGVLSGGIATYNHEGFTCKCCDYKCGNIFGRCYGCNCKKCGEWTWTNPNTHQPYICWRGHKRSPSNSNPLLKDPEALQAHHSGCTNGHSRHPDCLAAIHRRCSELGFGAGISQEIGSNVFGTACFNPASYGDVSVATLKAHHGDCNHISKSQSNDCMAAIHRFCQVSGHTAGISQEVGNGVFGVACVDAPFYGDIAVSELRSKHGGCTSSGKAQTPDCVAAIHRACGSRGFNTGWAQELGSTVVGVVCFNSPHYRDLKVNEREL